MWGSAGWAVEEVLFRTLAVAVAVAATAAAAAVVLLLLLFELRRRPYGRRAAKEAKRVCDWGSGEVVRAEFEGVAGERSRTSGVAVVGLGGG